MLIGLGGGGRGGGKRPKFFLYVYTTLRIGHRVYGFATNSTKLIRTYIIIYTYGVIILCGRIAVGVESFRGKASLRVYVYDFHQG